MVCLTLMFAVVIIEYVSGRPPLPPLPMKDGCYLMSPELEIFRLEGEAIILSFPNFMRALKLRNIGSPTAKYLMTKRDNGTEHEAKEGDGHVQQRNKQLWFLPAKASDSGEYICTYRNETYCVTGSIVLHVYDTSSVDMEKLSYPIKSTAGRPEKLPCPSLDDFPITDRMIEWYRGFNTTALELSRGGSFQQDGVNVLIRSVRRSHEGLYTCRLRVLINDQQYKVSRTIQLRVQGQDPVITTTVPDPSVTSDPELGSSYNTVHTPVFQPPVIISPLNRTIFESSHGSGVELFCKVVTECEMAESTVVTWLVNSQSVESSYLDGRALQGGRRVTKVSTGCHIELRLYIIKMTEEDVNTELKCITQNQGGKQEVVAQLQLEDPTFTWVVVAVVAVSCFLTVVSVFLYVLFKPKRNKKMDYILARQNSTF